MDRMGTATATLRGDPEKLLRALFAAAVERADPMRVVPAHLPPRPDGRVIVVGAGKAAARMAEAVEAVWGAGGEPVEGLVVTRYGHARPTRRIEVAEAAHPVPDAAGERATERMLALVRGAGAGDLVLVLISGGASALLVAHAPAITLADKAQVNAALLASGAPIDRINLVRKHLSRVKGGQLAAAAWPARVLCLMISDVPGDDPAMIGSGPTVGDGSTPADALAVLERWRVAVPARVTAALAQGSGVVPPGDPRLARTRNEVIAAPAQSLDAAADLARAAGCEVRILGDRIEGEAREVAQAHAALALRERAARRPGDAPLVLLSGGELTVTRRNEQTGGGTGDGIADGIGGPNAEYALALAVALEGAAGIHAIACDTDGVDGAAEVAGAVIGPDTLVRARSFARDSVRALDRHDAHGFFAAVGGQVVTGPTLTNVNDFRALLILPPDAPKGRA